MQDSSSATTQRPGENRRNNVGNLDVEIDTCAKCARTLKQTELEERLHFRSIAWAADPCQLTDLSAFGIGL
jgi:hypothetical protein